jgi:FKBP-type peptidyl-prolyl cis-trans isomerase
MQIRCFKVMVMVCMAVIAFPLFSQNFKGFSKTKTGLYYKLYKNSKDTAKANIGNYVEFDMIYHGKVHGKDSVFFDSRKSNQGTVKFFLPPPVFSGDLNEGIRMMSVGDSGLFVVNADSLIFKTFRLKKRPDGIDSNSYFYFHLNLVSIRTNESMIFREEQDIKKYVDDNKITAKPNSLGLYIIEDPVGTGPKIDSGSHVSMKYSVSLLNGKVLFNSFEKPDPIKFEFGKHIDVTGFEMALSTLHKGSKAKVLVPSLLAFGRKGTGTIVDPYTPLLYDVEILNVQSKEDFEKEETANQKVEEMKTDSLKNAESGLREKYLKDNHIKETPLPSGLIYIPVVKGNGAQAEAGKTVKVQYTGKLLNGKIFDSSRETNQPEEFMLGRAQVIKGWDEGIALMKVGGKATLIIPSSLGYAERDMGRIPPYSTLVFDVELVEVK